MNTKNDVEVIINGRTYIISGYESSEYMQKIATHINSKYDEFKKSDSFPKLDQEMKNILLAINLSDDYYKAQDVVVNLQKDNEDLEKEIFHMKHDMIDLKSRLEKQEKTERRKKRARTQVDSVRDKSTKQFQRERRGFPGRQSDGSERNRGKDFHRKCIK